MSSISHKLHALLGQQQQQHHYPESDDEPSDYLHDHDHQEDQDQSNGKAAALVVYNINASSSSSNNDIINPTDDDHIHMTADSEDNIVIDDDIDHGYLHLVKAQAQAQAGDVNNHHLDVDNIVISNAENYPGDLTLLDSEEEDQFESVIDIVKNSKQEAGQEFSLEDEIDHVADLFIRRFHRQITIHKQHSFKSKRAPPVTG